MTMLGRVCCQLCRTTVRSQGRVLWGVKQSYSVGHGWNGLRHIAVSSRVAHSSDSERQQQQHSAGDADDRSTSSAGTSTSESMGENNLVITLPTMLTLGRVAAIPVLIAGELQLHPLCRCSCGHCGFALTRGLPSHRPGFIPVYLTQSHSSSHSHLIFSFLSMVLELAVLCRGQYSRIRAGVSHGLAGRLPRAQDGTAFQPTLIYTGE